MNIFRWIFGIIISIIISVIGTSIIEPLLNIALAIFGGYGRTGWVEMPTSFGDNLSFFNNELLPLCIASVIAYSIGGYCCGKIVPAGNKNIISWICGVTITILNLTICIFVWNGAHWFYSSVFVIAMAISGLFYVSIAGEVNNR